MRAYFTKPDIARLRREGNTLVDMHAHSEYSHDCRTPLALVIEKARAEGYCVALTDHNRVDGVATAMRMRAHDTIMPGIEITTKEGKDVIAYFYRHKDLLAFYEKRLRGHIKRKSSIRSGATGITMAALLDELRKEECVICLPHPFAMRPRRSYGHFRRKKNRGLLEHVHAIEVINQALLHRQNLAAVGWATELGKPIVAGSDAHTIKALGTALTVGTAKDWAGFLDQVKERKVFVIGEERKFRHQMVDSVKNGTRVLATKARILRKRKV